MPRNLVPRPEARGTVGKSTRKWVEGFFDYVTGALRITPQGNISATTAQEALYELDNEKLGKTENAATATKLAATFKINGVPTDGSADISVPASIAGVENNIVNGRKITATSGLQVTISAGREVINEATISRVENNVAIPVRSVALVCDKSDGTTEAILGSYPLGHVDNNTVGLWIFNQATGASVPNSAVGLSSIAVANAMVPAGGLTRVDGRCDYATKGDGTSGSFASQNPTGFPIGAAAREVNILWTCKNSTATECIASYGGTAGSALMLLTSGGKFVLSNGGTTILDSGFYVENEGDYYVTFKYESGVMKIYIAGKLIASVSVALTTVAGVLYVGKASVGTAYYTSGVIHFVSIRNAIKSDIVTAEISNKLAIPCFYTALDGKRRNIINDLVSPTSVVVAYVKTSSAVVSVSNDLWPAYGRREGATVGNRKHFLPWQAFSGAQPLKWANPFGMGCRYKCKFYWSQDSKGTNQLPCVTYFSTGAESYGIFPNAGVTGYNDAHNITASTGNTWVVFLNGAPQSTGYIGAYAEMLEDYVGVV